MLPSLARHACLLALLLPGLAPLAAAADEAVWQRLAAGGQVVLMRHSSTPPGIGDPPGFDLADCATQRNLSSAGRDEALRIGQALRARKVPIGEVRSSRWCRCLDTARLAFGTSPEPWPLLDSLFDATSGRAAQTEALRRALAETRVRGNLFLVTHQANIVALTGLSLAPGEMIMLAPRSDGRHEVLGRISPAALAAP
jgi:phosphohistidine phosphatase SixA